MDYTEDEANVILSNDDLWMLSESIMIPTCYRTMDHWRAQDALREMRKKVVQ